MTRGLRLIACAAVAFALVPHALAAPRDSLQGGPPPPPPARAIPGLTADDPHPRGCVDCHRDMKEFNMDTRLSTLMGKWREGVVEPRLLTAAKAAAADSTKITGKHPPAAGTLKNIPSACLVCHGKSSKTAPPFARMLHLIHLTGGDANPYMGYFQGDCTHCHKLNQSTGGWSMPSGAEP